MEIPSSKPLKSSVLLRDVIVLDLPVFYEQQLDPDATFMTAFTAKDPTDREAFIAQWSKILSDETAVIQTILFERQIAGYVLSHSWFGEPEISYWLGKSYWGSGIASTALTMFLEKFEIRPLYARAAKDNVASIRVLEKCGFAIVGEGKGYANARGAEVDEFILKLET